MKTNENYQKINWFLKHFFPLRFILLTLFKDLDFDSFYWIFWSNNFFWWNSNLTNWFSGNCYFFGSKRFGRMEASGFYAICRHAFSLNNCYINLLCPILCSYYLGIRITWINKYINYNFTDFCYIIQYLFDIHL